MKHPSSQSSGFWHYAKVRLTIYLGFLIIAASAAYNQTSFWTVFVCAFLGAAGLIDTISGYAMKRMLATLQQLAAALKNKQR